MPSLARPLGPRRFSSRSAREKSPHFVAITTPYFREMAETLLKLRMNLSPPQGDPSCSLSAGYRFGLRWAVSSFLEGTVPPCVARSPSRIWGRSVLTRPSSPRSATSASRQPECRPEGVHRQPRPQVGRARRRLRRHSENRREQALDRRGCTIGLGSPMMHTLRLKDRAPRS